MFAIGLSTANDLGYPMVEVDLSLNGVLCNLKCRSYSVIWTCMYGVMITGVKWIKGSVFSYFLSLACLVAASVALWHGSQNVEAAIWLRIPGWFD